MQFRCLTAYYAVIVGQVGYCLFNYPSQEKSGKVSYSGFFLKDLIIKCRLIKDILITILLSFLAFIIWLSRVINLEGFQISIGADYTWKEFPLKIVWQRIILNLTGLISDFESSVKSQILTRNFVDVSLLDLSVSHIFTVFFICGILFTSLWYIIHYSDRSRTALLGWLALPSILFLTKDLLFGGSAVSIIRYQLLSVFGLYVALSFFLVHLFQKTSLKWLKNSIIALVIILFQMQIHSNFNYLKNTTWWNKYGDYQLQEFARDVHQSSHPLVLGETNYREMVNLLKLSYVLSPSVPFQLVDKEHFSEQNFKDYQIFWVPKI